MEKNSENGAQSLLRFSHMIKRRRREGSNFKSKKIFINGEELHYYFTESEMEKILQSAGSFEVGITESLYLYEGDIERLIQNTDVSINLPKYVDWIKQKDLKVIVKDGDLLKISGVPTNYEKLNFLRESCSINQDLKIDFGMFFMFYSTYYLHAVGNSVNDLVFRHTEDNNGIEEFFEEKTFNHKVFEIIKDSKKHVLRISVESEGHFKFLLDDGFISYLIRLIAPGQSFRDGSKFNKEIESVHFVYTSSGNYETVVLSVQTLLNNS